MQIKILEQDKNYIQSFTDFLTKNYFARVVDEQAMILEVPDGFDLDLYHGIEAYPSKSVVEQASEMPEYSWIKKYEGQSPYLNSLKDQIITKNYLSPKQIKSITEAIQKSSVPKLTDPSTFTLKLGDVIEVSKWAAQKIASLAGMNRPHYTMTVIKVLSESEKAIRVEVKLTASRTSRCCVCGITLTNTESRLAGIGPICAEKSQVSFGANSLVELEEKLRTTQNVTAWIPKKSIKSTLKK